MVAKENFFINDLFEISSINSAGLKKEMYPFICKLINYIYIYDTFLIIQMIFVFIFANIPNGKISSLEKSIHFFKKECQNVKVIFCSIFFSFKNIIII